MITQDTVATIARLFEVALDRDGLVQQPGLNYWIDVFEARVAAGETANAALHAIAAGFLGSAEFTASFGAAADLPDRAFVEQLYLNMRDAPGGAAGVDYWTARLADPDFDRADLLLSFANSAECVAATPWAEDLTPIAPGEWWFPDDTVAGDLPAGPQTPLTISGDGGLLISRIDSPGDIDWVAVTLEAGAEYSFRAKGSSNDPIIDPALALYAPQALAGDLPFAMNDTSDRLDPAIFYRPASDQTVFLAISAAPGDTGGYRATVTASTETPEDPRDGPTTQYHVVPQDGVWRLSDGGAPGTLGEVGALGLPDLSDWYAAVFGSGQAVRISLSGVGADPLEDGDLILRDAGGDPLVQAGGPGEVTLDFIAPATDTVYIDVALADGAGSYDLEVLLL